MKRSNVIELIKQAFYDYKDNDCLRAKEASENLLKKLENLGMQPPGKQKLEETFDDDRWGREIPGTRRTVLNWAKTQDSGNFPIKKFYPDWGKHGKAAGPIRNKQMAEYADALLLIWDGESKGSKNMKEEMLKLNKPVYEFIVKQY